MGTLPKPTWKEQWFLNDTYIWLLQRIVAASRAPVLKLSVVKGFKQRGVKVLKSNIVEKLVVEGPCTLNLVPVMSKLKVVEVKLDLFPLDSDKCTHWKSKQDDRKLHRNGLCCVNFGTMFEKCPNLEEFMGLEVRSVPKALSTSGTQHSRRNSIRIIYTREALWSSRCGPRLGGSLRGRLSSLLRIEQIYA